MRVSTMIRRIGLLLGLVVLLGSSGVTSPARAAGGWYVAPGGADTNTCAQPAAPCATINGALAKASPGDTLFVATGTYTGTHSPVVLLNKETTVSGGWEDGFTRRGGASTVSGQGGRRTLEVGIGISATLETLTIRGGYSSSSDGACIENRGRLRLVGSTVTGCSPGGSSGFVVHNGGTLTLEDSSVTRSQSNAISNDGVLTLMRSTVSDNESLGIQNYAGSIAVHDSRIVHNGSLGVANDKGTVTLDHCSVSDNGTGVYNSSGTVILNNSTVSGNANTFQGAGIHQAYGGLVILNNSTVSNNRALLHAGGIHVITGTVILRNSLVAGNTARGKPADCAGNLTSAGYNLIGATSGCTFTQTAGDLVNLDAWLGSLVGVPGRPGYHPLLPGSPAIDAGNPAGCADGDGQPLATDQRGMPRVGRCDIGAYEYTSPGPASTLYAYAGAPQHAPPLSAFGMALQAALLDADGSPVPGVTVLFTAPASAASGTFADSGEPLTTAVTDGRGIAGTATLAANDVHGSYTVTATVAGSALTTTYELANTAWYVAPGGNDANDCLRPATPCATIREATWKPRGDLVPGDTIRVAVGVYREEIYLPGLTLSGGWNPAFTAQVGMSTVDGEGLPRGGILLSYPSRLSLPAAIERFTVQNVYRGDYVTAAIENDGVLTIRHCVITHNTQAGGINNDFGATLTIVDSTISDNAAQYSGGGVTNRGVLTLDRCTVAGNKATGQQPGDGGGIVSDGTLDIRDSSITGNEAGRAGGGIHCSGETTLAGSAVVGNVAHAQGGGICAEDGTLTLDNSTVAGNSSADSGGGIYKGRYSYGTRGLYLNNVTVSGNRSDTQGGGIHVQDDVLLRNSILAGNVAPSAPDCLGALTSGGYNLLGAPTAQCVFTPAAGDLLGVDARLWPVTGAPAYHPLQPDSPAIDAGNPAGCVDHDGAPLRTDQRGSTRPVDGDGDGTATCDLGAFEYDPRKDGPVYVFLPVIRRR